MITKVLDISRKITRRFAQDHITAFSAQSAFFLMLSFFPFVMLLCLSSRLLPFSEQEVVAAIKEFVPGQFTDYVADVAEQYYTNGVHNIGYILIIFIVWSASRVVLAMTNGFNAIKGIKETRGQFVLRLISCIYTLIFCGILTVIIFVFIVDNMVFGYLKGQLPQLEYVYKLIPILKHIAGPIFMFLVLLLIYITLPNQKTTILQEIPGTVFSIVGWILLACFYYGYIQRAIEKYAYIYGSLTGIVMVLLWLYQCMYIMFAGAELNSAIGKLWSENIHRKSRLHKNKKLLKREIKQRKEC